LATERPDQILAVLVRDVETNEPIDDPTGWAAVGADLDPPSDTPRARRSLSDILTGRKPVPLFQEATLIPLHSA
ncbi:hypothetical protein H0H81_009970, partial [Sphagnurus paluster]